MGIQQFNMQCRLLVGGVHYILGKLPKNQSYVLMENGFVVSMNDQIFTGSKFDVYIRGQNTFKAVVKSRTGKTFLLTIDEVDTVENLEALIQKEENTSLNYWLYFYVNRKEEININDEKRIQYKR